jgi:hypothetical protein
VRDDRDVDACGVHLLDPPVAQVMQPGVDHFGELRVEAGVARSLLVELT